MTIKRRVIVVIISCIVIALVVFGFMVRAAGFARQARFNVDVIYKVIIVYYNRNQSYPANLKELPRFYVVSALEKFYLDSAKLARGAWDGYRYDFKSFGKNNFVLSASPVGFWPAGIEYGITAKGVLKANDHRPDKGADLPQEVESWRAVDSLNKIGFHEQKTKSP